jgi:hypothetical protein
MEEYNAYASLDVHKETIAVAYPEEPAGGGESLSMRTPLPRRDAES